MIIRSRLLIFMLGLFLCGTMIWATTESVYAANPVKTTIPTFKVTLNGTTIQNEYSQYPLIVYRDITYFPMTYFDCRFLSVETDWQGNQKGLFVGKSDVRGAYTPYTQNKKNNRSNQATVVNFPVTINGKSINNAKEPYPLLNFRDVTYFPMTWRFCVDEFGWEYSFDSKNGLVIRSSDKAVDSSGALPNKIASPYLGEAVTMDAENAYYMDKNGQIIRMPLEKIMKGRNASISEGNPMYQVPKNTYSDNYCQPVFYDSYGKKYLWFNTGGGVMGSRYWLEMDPAEFKECNSSQQEYFEIWGREFTFWSGGTPGPNNLSWKNDSGEWKSLGDPNYIYGWDWEVSSESSGGSVKHALWYDGGYYVYTLGFDYTDYYWEGSKAPDEELYSRTTGIVRVDIRDNTTERISPANQRVRNFIAEMKTGKIYYQAGGNFYVYDTSSGSNEVYASAGKEFDAFAVADGTVFVVSGYNPMKEKSEGTLAILQRDGSLKTINEVYRWQNMSEKTDLFTGEKYLVVSCQDGAGAPYHLVVLDKNGNVVLKNSDITTPNNAAVSKGTIYYYNKNTQRICGAKL